MLGCSVSRHAVKGRDLTVSDLHSMSVTSAHDECALTVLLQMGVVKVLLLYRRMLKACLLVLGVLAVTLLPAGSSAATEASRVCAGADCVEVELFSPSSSINGDDYGSQSALEAKIDGRAEIAHPVENGVIAVVCAPTCAASTDSARLRSRDWFEGASVQVFAGDPRAPRSRARRVAFSGSFVRADDPIYCRNRECTEFDSMYVLNGRIAFPSSSAPGLYDLWFVVTPSGGPQLVVGPKRRVPLRVGFTEKPRLSLVQGRNQARPTVRIEASVLRRASKGSPFRLGFEALRRGPRGWGNPRMECPPKGTGGGCILLGWDPAYFVRGRRQLTRASTTLSVPIALPAPGRWRIDVGLDSEHLSELAGKRFIYVRR